LLRVLARSGQDTKVLDYAESLRKAYMGDRASVPPSLVETASDSGAIRGDRALFDEYRKRFESTTVPIERGLFLAGLGSFKDPDLRALALSYALSGPLRPQEPLTIPNAMATD